MNEAEKKRLAELKAKSADQLSAAEKTELAALEAKNAAGDGSPLTIDEAKKLIVDAVKEAHAASASKPLDETAVKAVVETALKGHKFEATIDKASLVAEISAAVKGSFTPGVTTDQVKALLEDALKDVRKQSKMQFPEDEGGHVELPIAHRKGNLSVAMKQLLNVMTRKDINAEIPDTLLKGAEKKGAEMANRIAVHGVKALTAATAGSGLELLPVDLGNVLLQRLYLESLFAQALMSQEIQMPSNPFKLPMITTRPTFQKGAEATLASESSPGTASPVLTAQKVIGMTEFDYEADEDSIIPILPMVTQQLGVAAADAFENATINGDTAGATDSDDTSSTAVTRCYDGVRKLVLAQGSTLAINLATGGISAANISAVRKALGKWGIRPQDLLLVFGTNGYNDCVLLPETLTAEKTGGRDQARIFTGQVPSLFGIDILCSARVRENLNASGVYDGTTTTKGNFMLLYKPAWLVGVKQGFMVELFRDIKYQATYVVASFRRAFTPVESLANTYAAALGYGYNS